MVAKKKSNLLMISSSSSLGGGTKNMFLLGENLRNDFTVYYAIPKSKNFSLYLDSENHLEISERKINLKDLIELQNFIKKKSIDLIHAHGKGAGVISRILWFFSKKPIVYTFHGIHLKCHSWYSRLAYISYEYLSGWIDSAKVLVSNSEKLFAKKSKIFLGKNSIVINNGVPNKKIKNYFFNEIDNSTIKNSSKVRVISICRFVTQKNIEEIIKIASLLKDIDFFLIGNGPLWKEINTLVLNLKITNVYLLGEKTNIFKYLYSSDIYLSTSLYEGLPISILEAMSIGLPIIASNVIGNVDTIENGKSGFLYNLKDIDMAMFYLNKLAKSKKLKQKIGKSAFQRQRKLFSTELMILKYINLYKKLIK